MLNARKYTVYYIRHPTPNERTGNLVRSQQEGAGGAQQPDSSYHQRPSPALCITLRPAPSWDVVTSYGIHASSSCDSQHHNHRDCLVPTTALPAVHPNPQRLRSDQARGSSSPASRRASPPCTPSQRTAASSPAAPRPASAAPACP